jgi:cytochrome c553
MLSLGSTYALWGAMHSIRTALRSAVGYGSGAVLTGFCCVLFSLPARSQSCEPEFAGNRARGQEIAAKFCAACHGADGQGISPQFPNLAAQIPEYLVKQLKAFKVRSDGKPLRPSDVMTPIVAALTEDDFTDVAAYYAKLEPRARAARDAARLEVGRRIYTEGNADEGLPACITCHRPSGSGIRPDFPRLSGQSAEYLDGQLSNWMAVRGKPGKLMTMIVPHIQPTERQAVSDYISQLR